MSLENASAQPASDVVAPIWVPPEFYVGRWSKPLKRPVALATFAAAAMATGIWHPIRLEEELLRRDRSYQAASGKLRRLAKGIPSDKSGVMGIQRVLPGHPIAYWANHPIFHLLDVDAGGPMFDQALMYALNSVEGPLRRHLWPELQSQAAGTADMRFAPVPDETAMSNALYDNIAYAQLSELSQLTLSLAAFLKAQRSRNQRLAIRAAQLTCTGFVGAALRHKPLFAAHQDLAQVLIDKVWIPAGEDDWMEPVPNIFTRLLSLPHVQEEWGIPSELLQLAGLLPRGKNPRKSRRQPKQRRRG